MNLYNAKNAREFYRIIKKHYKHYHKHTINANKDLDTVKNFLFQEMPSTKFLDYSFVRNYIPKCKYYFKVSCENCLFHIVSRSTPDLKNIYKTINDTILVRELYNIQKTFEFFLIMNPQKRMFPKNCCMQSRHINGGFTNPNSNQIFIIRKQEYAKVMIHELLHHNRQIHNDNWNSSNINRLKNHFKIAKECRFYPNEAVIETLACMIYVCLQAIHLQKNSTQFLQLLKKEKTHICILANKIIRMQNAQHWYEETNSFCYIVLRCILFCHFEKFLQIYNNEELLTDFLVIKKIPKHIEDIKELRLLC